MDEDLFYIFFWLLVLFIYWIFYNIQLIKVANYFGTAYSWIVWVPFPIFYLALYLDINKKSAWHILWCFILSFFLQGIPILIYFIWLNALISKKLGMSAWLGAIWFIAPFFWAPVLKNKKKYKDPYLKGDIYECEKCNKQFHNPKKCREHEKTCNKG